MVVLFGIFSVKYFRKSLKRFIGLQGSSQLGFYDYETGSMTDILKMLKSESLKKNCKDCRLIFIYIDLKVSTTMTISFQLGDVEITTL